MAGTQQSRDAKIDRPGDGQVRLAQWPKAILFLCVGFMFGSKSNENPISLEISYFQKLDFPQIYILRSTSDSISNYCHRRQPTNTDLALSRGRDPNRQVTARTTLAFS